MMKSKIIARRVIVLLGALSVAILAGFSIGAIAHSGGLNAEGCHNDRKRGGYHCHGGGRAERPPTPKRDRTEGLLVASSRYFPNCAAARAAGEAPMRRGDPGYRAGLDRDNDGVACE